MAKFKSPVPGIVEPLPTNETYIVGLRKVGSDRYVVVTGTLSAPVYDKASDPLNFALEAVRAAALKLGQSIP